MRQRPSGRAAVLGLLTLLGTSTRAAADELDYLPTNSAWNGLSELAELAAARGRELVLIEKLDWARIAPDATLLCIYPTSPLPVAELLHFVRGGGTLLIADDFGSAGPLFHALGLERVNDRTVGAARYHEQNDQLPIAVATARLHPLTDGVPWVITNHPAFFATSGAYPVLTFGAGQELLLVKELGRGRVVALADPSLLINGMLAFPQNRKLATNLLSFLMQNGDVQLRLLSQDLRVTGAPSTDAADPAFGTDRDPTARFLGDYNHFLRRLGDWAPTDAALRTAVAVLALGCLAVTLLVVRTARRRVSRRYIQPTPAVGNLMTRVKASRRGQTSLEMHLATMQLRELLEDELTSRLQLNAPVFTLTPAYLEERVAAACGSEALPCCQRVLRTMAHLPLPATQTGYALTPGRLASPREFAALFADGQELLAHLGSDLLETRATSAAADDNAAAAGVT